jgi:hypothetical protein
MTQDMTLNIEQGIVHHFFYLSSSRFNDKLNKKAKVGCRHKSTLPGTNEMDNRNHHWRLYHDDK